LKKILAPLLAIFITLTFANAQGNRLDSLLKALDIHTKPDSQQVSTLRLIARYYRSSNSKKAVEYFTKALAAAEGISSNRYIANLTYDRGHSYYDAANYDAALSDYLNSAKAFEILNDSSTLFEVYISIGNVYSDLNNYQKVGEYYTRAEHWIDKTKDSTGLATLYSQWAIIYEKRGISDSAMMNYEKALKIVTLINDREFEYDILSNIGLHYKHLGNLDKALTYYDSAISVYNSIGSGDLFSGGALYNNLASAYSKAGKIGKALEAFKLSIDYSKKAGAQSIEMENYINMADMYGSIKDYKNQALYLQKHYSLKDSILNADKLNKLNELESDYQLAKKNEEILKKDVDVAKANSTRNLISILGAFVLVVALGLVFFLRKTRITNALLAKQNHEINEQRKELQKLNAVKDRLFSIVSHDLRNPLATLQSYLALSENTSLTPEKQTAIKEQTRALMHQTTDLLDNLLVWAHSQIRGTAISVKQVEINPLIEDCIHLIEAQASQKNIAVHFKNDKAWMALGDEHALSVVFRNLLTNAVKFTRNNGRINIAAEKKEQCLVVAISDNGIGMNQQTLNSLLDNEATGTRGTNNEAGTGLGMLLVQDLLKKMGGRLEAESKENEGTTFYVYLDQL